MSAVVVGNSGVGKTVAIHRSLSAYPAQVIVHDSFPRVLGPHLQMLHLSVDVPGSGKLADLASSLMLAWDEAMTRFDPGMPRRFSAPLSSRRPQGLRLINEWRQVASAHFLGLLHLDEVQNFFKISTLESRRSDVRRRAAAHGPELRIVEDETLKTLLTLSNTAKIPLLLSGTPDGVGALTKRLSNLQRFVASGYHPMPEFSGPGDPYLKEFMKVLSSYQFVAKKIEVNDKLLALVYDATAGIHRIIIALWISAHRVALERSSDDLVLEDFVRASRTFLKPLLPAVTALKSKDPALMARYEDLMPRDDNFWSAFWSGATA